jgi:hypothetical protein
MLTKTLLIVLGNLIFLYIFWSRLKEDYQSQNIFSAAVYILLSATVFYQLARYFTPPFWFWIVIVGILVGFGVAVLRFGFRLTETMDALIISLLPLEALVFINDYINTNNAESLIALFVVLALILLYFLFNAHYKKFTWYKSGRIGFSGLAVLGFFFLARALFASLNFFMVSFSGKYEVYLSSVSAFISFLILFNLARKGT